MKKAMKRLLAATSAGAVLCGSLALSSLLGSSTTLTASAETDSVADQTKVGTLGIAGGGFVSGIITGKNVMYARTDVGGAYKYNYDTGNWDHMLDDLNEAANTGSPGSCSAAAANINAGSSASVQPDRCSAAGTAARSAATASAGDFSRCHGR